jgi:hypothetical protein
MLGAGSLDMRTTRNRKVGAAAVAVVALAGVGTALAASKLNNHSGTGNAAQQRGFAAGPQQFGHPNGNGYDFGFGNGGPRAGGLGFRGPGGDLSAAASYLGLTQPALFADLESGKTLAQIANATSGKSASGLIDAMVAQQKSDIDAAVKAGRITQAIADRLEANLKQRVTQMVNGSFGGGFRGRGFGPPGDGGGFGSPPGRQGTTL